MHTIQLTDQELDVIKKSLKHCLETCKQGGPSTGCPECSLLERLLARLP